jgi:hypothetical protein
MHEEYSFFCIWCGAHQFDLVMEHIINEMVKESFFLVITSFITDLIRQHKLIMDMGTMCPCIVNRWFFTYKVTKWFKIHRHELLAHIESKQPASAPPRLWWACLLAMDDFTSRTTIIFLSQDSMIDNISGVVVSKT